MHEFDPNLAVPEDAGIFGLPFTPEESRLVLYPIPWDVTTSSGDGANEGPAAIFEAGRQVDLHDSELGEFYEPGIAMLEADKKIIELNRTARQKAKKVIEVAGFTEGKPMLERCVRDVNAACAKLNELTYKTVRSFLDENKLVGIIGGDHGSLFGGMHAFIERHPAVGILQIDAHADLRKAFEGFRYSHASIMYNVLTELPLKKLVQVGVRDLCGAEQEMITRNQGRVQTFFDHDLAARKHEGTPWKILCEEITEALPKEVYITFDIDGLDPSLCPGTGTPVPGGLQFQEAVTLLRTIVGSGRTIIGFDLNEVSPKSVWDANVGSRILFKLCGWTLKSNSK
jgi:agmatinase